MGTVRSKQRDTNIELYRCVVMLLIVAHHYMMHSGLLNVTPYCLTSAKTIYLYLFGMWGKTGINCFVLITGYYMCISQISKIKYMRLLLQVEFYKITIYFFLWVAEDKYFDIVDFVFSILPFTDISNSFVDCFFVFYLFIPFLNILVNSMDRRQHLMLIALCISVFSIWPQFHLFIVDSNYVIWFCVVYFVASYIRMYGIDELVSYKIWGLITLFLIILAYASVVALLYHGSQWPYFFVYDCNTLLTLVISICSFMFFKHLPIKNSKFVNNVGATTFGVLLIHDCSWNMRNWLWNDVCNTVEWYNKNVYTHSMFCVLGVFVICSIIDYFRLNLIERPLFCMLKKMNICRWF